LSSEQLDQYIPPIIQSLITLLAPTTSIIIAAVGITRKLGKVEGKGNVVKEELKGKIDVLEERIKNAKEEIDKIDKRITYTEQLKMAESPNIAKDLMKQMEKISKEK
jgi:hypothetical protein